MLAYANRYDADREDVLVCMADANAGQALADHAADAVKHITASERLIWNAKETTDGAQEKPTRPKLSVYNEGTGGNIGYGCHIFHTGSNVVVSVRGLQIAAKTVPLGTLCCVAVSYDGDTRCIAAINGTVTVKEAPAYVYPHEPRGKSFGRHRKRCRMPRTPRRLVAAHRFSLLTAEDRRR